METADDGTHENQVQANAYLRFANFSSFLVLFTIEQPTRKINILNVFYTNSNQLMHPTNNHHETSMSDHKSTI